MKKFSFVDPKIIFLTVISLIILSVGSFAFYTVFDTVGYTKEQTETFTVTDPSHDLVVTLEYFPTSIVSVQEYDGTSWNTISDSGYELHFKEIKISKDYLKG